MDTLILAIAGACSYFIILVKFIGIARLVHWAKWFDLAFTLGVPILTATTGTFSAVKLSILTGLFFTLLMLVVSAIYRLTPLIK